MNLPVLRRSILAFGVAGFAFFAAAFIASYASPGFVEQIAKDVIRYEVEKRVHEKIESLDGGFLAGKAAQLAQGYNDEIARARRQLAEQLPARLASAIAEMRNLDCECRKKIEGGIREGLESRIAFASQAQEHLTVLIRAKYMETAEQLTREFRIFTGTNALVFALLALAVLVKRKAGLHLLPSALVLFAAATTTAYFYLFGQNWLHTIVFNDYVGWGYVAYLAIAFAALCDIIFNGAEITVNVLNALLDAIGSALSVVPC